MFRPRRQIYHFCSKSYDGSRGPLRKKPYLTSNERSRHSSEHTHS
uniref:Uncharacterized protein n=1 Tax=Anguilla anguilla TaxID=7936 RepID=A0A0E9QBZ1_ANGAN